MPRVRVVLAARNRLLRETLLRILRKRNDVVVSAECLDCSELTATIAKYDSDVVLMDSPQNADWGFEFVTSVQKLNPGIEIIMIGMDQDEARFLAAVRAGVAGYLLSDASACDVVTAIRAVAQGEAVCPPLLCRTLFKYLAQKESSLSRITSNGSGLTRRELELIPMIARGLSNKEIASQLNLSEQTVKNHVHRMLQKLGAEHRLEVPEIVASMSS